MRTRPFRYINIALFVSLLFSFNFNVVSAKTNYPINAWIMDESKGFIYAVSTSSNKLLFIRMSDLTVKKTVEIENGPSDVKLYKGKLYIAASKSKSIKIVDAATQSIKGQILTKVKPYHIALVDNKLFYTEIMSRSSYIHMT